MTDRIAAWVDMRELCFQISTSERTVDAWVLQGILPPPRKRGGKLMWKWSEVDTYLTNGEPGRSPDSKADEIRNGTRQAALSRG